jgi:ABC-type Fe3+/spermidine/putrescine transport system ATPase subunit
MAAVELRGASKSFGTTPVLQQVDLVVHEGEFLVLVGPSGCGKSTLLRAVARYPHFRPSAGRSGQHRHAGNKTGMAKRMI